MKIAAVYRYDLCIRSVPSVELILKYGKHYGKPYTGPSHDVVMRMMRGRNIVSGNCYKMATGVIHRGKHGFSQAYEEIRQICKEE